MPLKVSPEAVTASRTMRAKTQSKYNSVATDLLNSFYRPGTSSSTSSPVPSSRIETNGACIQACTETARCQACKEAARANADTASAAVEADMLRLRRRRTPKKVAHESRDESKPQQVAKGSKDESKPKMVATWESIKGRGGIESGNSRGPRMSLPGTGPHMSLPGTEKEIVAKESSKGRRGKESGNSRGPRMSLPGTGKEWERARRFLGEEPRFMRMKTVLGVSRELDAKLAREARESRHSIVGFGTSEVRCEFLPPLQQPKQRRGLRRRGGCIT